MILRDHYGAVEADFRAHYGIDLRRALWGPEQIGVRRLLNLVAGLPRGSALHRSLDPVGWDWTNTDDLLVYLLGVYGMKVTRPGLPATAGPRKQSSKADMQRVFGAHIKVVE